MTSRTGRIWTVVMLVIILVLPLIALLLLKKGFETRRDAPASERLLTSGLEHIPPYATLSFRGDSITDSRMLGKVTVLNFAGKDCVPAIDARMRKLYEIQADYYGKTLSLRIITNTLDPVADDLVDLQRMSERYAGREVWHFVRGEDSSGVRLYNWCDSVSQQYFPFTEPDPACPRLVYLIDSDGFFRGAYDLEQEQHFHDLYNDILFLVNKLDLDEQEN